MASKLRLIKRIVTSRTRQSTCKTRQWGSAAKKGVGVRDFQAQHFPASEFSILNSGFGLFSEILTRKAGL
jgi:hypothetical protein